MDRGVSVSGRVSKKFNKDPKITTNPVRRSDHEIEMAVRYAIPCGKCARLSD